MSLFRHLYLKQETIAGKCRVLCKSNDQRNRQPSNEELENAEYIFFRTFDVTKFSISDIMPDKIAGVDVRYLLNQKEDQKTTATKSKASSSVAEDQPSKKLRLIDKSLDASTNLLTKITGSGATVLGRASGEKDDTALKKVNFGKGTKFSDELLLENDPVPVEKKTDQILLDATRSQFVDRRRWFRHDMMYHFFQQQCRVMVIQQATFQNPIYGQAYVIFKTKDGAEQAVKDINCGCLMLSPGRPLISSIGMLKIPEKISSFAGHLPTYKGRYRVQRVEMRSAVSTSHCSQPNTIECDLALEWLLLQEKFRRSQKLLNERHRKERRYFMNHLKTK